MLTASRLPSPELGIYQIVLETTGHADLSPNPARLLHAAMLDLVRQFDPPLALRLHQTDVNSWTIGPLRCSAPDSDSSTGATRLLFRCGTLDAWTTGSLERALRQAIAGGHALRLGPIVATILDAVHVSLPIRGGDLITRYADLAVLAPPAGECEIHFLAPTVFRHRGQNILTPRPRYVFDSFLRRWNAFSPGQCSPLNASILEQHIVLTDAQIHATRRVMGFAPPPSSHDAGGANASSPRKPVDQPGFTGSARYRIDGDASIRRHIAALAIYGLACGAGARTAFGMGEISVRLS